ncbi:MAG TPA: putative Ig domain-containing protein [Terriglobales bacterium]|nr:putative Ig domain-containing protein [Terriglobales bacterium]
MRLGLRCASGGWRAMHKLPFMGQVFALSAMLAGGIGLTAFGVDAAVTNAEQGGRETAPADPQSERGPVIENDSELPAAYPQQPYEFRFHARGAISVLHWKLEKGALPPGIKLDDNGLLVGEPVRAGEFRFTVSVAEDGRGESAVQKEFVLEVLAALALRWKDPAHVKGSRIEGTVTVSNTTPDDVDLTFIVLAVAGNGRATAIGYQHFLLARGTVAKDLPFGDTLPHGGYVVHVDAVGEVERKNLIYRERMQTARALQVTVGP